MLINYILRQPQLCRDQDRNGERFGWTFFFQIVRLFRIFIFGHADSKRHYKTLVATVQGFLKYGRWETALLNWLAGEASVTLRLTCIFAKYFPKLKHFFLAVLNSGVKEKGWQSCLS